MHAWIAIFTTLRATHKGNGNNFRMDGKRKPQEDPDCKFPLLYPRNKHGKAGGKAGKVGQGAISLRGASQE